MKEPLSFDQTAFAVMLGVLLANVVTFLLLVLVAVLFGFTDNIFHR